MTSLIWKGIRHLITLKHKSKKQPSIFTVKGKKMFLQTLKKSLIRSTILYKYRPQFIEKHSSIQKEIYNCHCQQLLPYIFIICIQQNLRKSYVSQNLYFTLSRWISTSNITSISQRKNSREIFSQKKISHTYIHLKKTAKIFVNHRKNDSFE